MKTGTSTRTFNATRLVAALACGFTVAAARPAPVQAAIDPATAVAVVQGLYDAYGKLKQLQGAFEPDLTLAQQVDRIIGELRSERNMWLRSRVQSLGREYQELFRNQQYLSESRYGAFHTEANMIVSYIEEVIRANNDVNSSYELAPTLNILVPLRAMAMKNENAVRRNMGLPIAHNDSTIAWWLANGASVNYMLVGAAVIKCTQPWADAFLSTIDRKQFWQQKFANYWFNAGFVPFGGWVRCNVAENRCIGRHTNEQRYKWIGDEYRKINAGFSADPVVQIIRGGLGAVMTTFNGGVYVNESLCHSGQGVLRAIN